DREELAASPPLDPALIDESQVGLVHERGRLERVAGRLPFEVVGGESPELVVDEREEPVACCSLPSDQPLQYTSDLGCLGTRHPTHPRCSRAERFYHSRFVA